MSVLCPYSVTIKTDEIYSPVDDSGLRIVPNKLFNYIGTHNLTLDCFHTIPARTWVVQGQGRWAGYSYAGCGKTREQDRCPYKGKGSYTVFSTAKR